MFSFKLFLFAFATEPINVIDTMMRTDSTSFCCLTMCFFGKIQDWILKFTTRIKSSALNRLIQDHSDIPANSPSFPGSVQVFHEISRSPGQSTKSPGNYLPWLFLHFLFINFLGNALLLLLLIKMATTLKIFGVVSRFLYSGGWQVHVCSDHSASKELKNNLWVGILWFL